MAARSDAPGGGQKKSGTLRLVGILVLALVAVGVGAVRMGWVHLPGSASDDSVLAKPQETAANTPAKSATASPANAELNLDAPATEPPRATPNAPARRPGTRGSGSTTSAATVTAVTPDAPRSSPQMARLDEHLTYQYNALDRRDPFQSLLTGEFVGHDVGGDAPPDPGGMKIVGIVWGATDQFAMVEDVRGNSYVLRKGDKLQNGYVESLRRDAVVVNVTADGQSQTVVIPFVRKGDANAH